MKKKTTENLQLETEHVNTFDELEEEVLSAVRSRFHTVYTIGPLQLLEKEIYGGGGDAIGSNLWKEDMECLEWLDKKKNDAVLYIKFGSITPLSAGQMFEFAWGFGSAGGVSGGDEWAGLACRVVPPAGEGSGTRGGGGFLTHCGWNSTVETISEEFASLIEMSTGKSPWPNAAATLHRIAFYGEAPEIPGFMSSEAKDFLSKFLRVDPKQRWTAKEQIRDSKLLFLTKFDSNIQREDRRRHVFSDEHS
ncbi:hypothetical protein MIMGU_mgv1a026153mg [Erythranthe guttata]|uniref:Protein kinase domain-containing protein n=1 Tax=Erythranthe guttata TaxID=4155 RepID=A0A022RYD6_ERYGU|nr:PREDICTED: 7-deoxyloganetin glucosyltransferase-like [Erythranthe guttata]EYU45069.1 hypothetical protein MIMGU_mgv1a026153mg [Erythranthe guttata]|eukprot:XP_012846766.1 PREDICTED: 7-deoxyloganetin glucosyltransferase-like [Erythranthe guttata]